MQQDLIDIERLLDIKIKQFDIKDLQTYLLINMHCMSFSNVQFI